MLKTRKSAKRRFLMNKKGKVKRHRAGNGHLATSKSRGRKRKLRKMVVAHETDTKRIRSFLPYG